MKHKHWPESIVNISQYQSLASVNVLISQHLLLLQLLASTYRWSMCINRHKVGVIKHQHQPINTNLATLLCTNAYNKYTRGLSHYGPFVHDAFSFSLHAVKDRNRTVSRRSELRSRTAFMDEQSNPFDQLQPMDAMIQHRGAKRGDR